MLLFSLFEFLFVYKIALGGVRFAFRKKKKKEKKMGGQPPEAQKPKKGRRSGHCERKIPNFVLLDSINQYDYSVLYRVVDMRIADKYSVDIRSSDSFSYGIAEQSLSPGDAHDQKSRQTSVKLLHNPPTSLCNPT
jgi:hypothetical protein